MPREASELLDSRQRLHLLQREVAAAAGDPGRIQEILETLQADLQELDVIHAELIQQNEELENAREELEIERYRYRGLFEQAPYGYAVTDLSGVVEEMNQAACGLLKAEAWFLTGKPFLFSVDEAHRNGVRSLLGRLRLGERTEEREVVLRTRRGDAVPVALTIVRDLDGPAREQRLRWMMRDLSQSKKTEEALRESEERLRHAQRLEAIGRLAGGIAHSFNNLLAAIVFHAELLREHLPPEDAGQRHVHDIQSAGERAAALARQLLAFSRKQVLQPQMLCLNNAISDLEPILRRLLGEDVELTVELGAREGYVNADPGQLEQVLLNLITNARDAMPYGGKLTIGTAESGAPPPEQPGLEAPSGPYLKLWVADSGAGMNEEVRSRLFEPFFTTKEKHKGTGLGLATVYGIVHQSGGRITVDSEPGKGTLFAVYLPRIEPPMAAAPKAERPVFAPAPRGSEVILLVEDEDNIRAPATEILESRGYQVLPAGDAAEALEVVAQHPEPIHLMITDVIMPGMSGGQLAERLARERPEIKVVYISGYPEDAIAHHGVLSPEHVFLQKPFSPSALLARVREVLDGLRMGAG